MHCFNFHYFYSILNNYYNKKTKTKTNFIPTNAGQRFLYRPQTTKD